MTSGCSVVQPRTTVTLHLLTEAPQIYSYWETQKLIKQEALGNATMQIIQAAHGTR